MLVVFLIKINFTCVLLEKNVIIIEIEVFIDRGVV